MCVVNIIFGRLHDEGYMDTFKNEVVKPQRFFEIFTPQNFGGEIIQIWLPASSKWPFVHPNGGHLAVEKVT